jgi:hypothetical protein
MDASIICLDTSSSYSNDTTSCCSSKFASGSLFKCLAVDCTVKEVTVALCHVPIGLVHSSRSMGSTQSPGTRLAWSTPKASAAFREMLGAVGASSMRPDPRTGHPTTSISPLGGSAITTFGEGWLQGMNISPTRKPRLDSPTCCLLTTPHDSDVPPFAGAGSPAELPSCMHARIKAGQLWPRPGEGAAVRIEQVFWI